MSNQTSSRDLVVVMILAFAFGALFAWAVIDPPVPRKVSGLQPSATPSEWPAWVQAIGSVAAIFVAIKVPTSIAHREQGRRVREAQLKSRTFALLLITRVDDLRYGIYAAGAVLGPMHENEFDRAREHLLARTQGDWLLQVHELGEAAVPLQTALVAAADLCELLAAWDTYAQGGFAWPDWDTGEKSRDPEPGDIATAVRLAGRHAERAATAVRKLIETE